VDRIERQNDRWVINDQYAAPLLIGAGGNFCPVARQLGSRHEEGTQSVAAQEVEFIATDEQLAVCPVSGIRPELFFCQDLAGYGWFFRKGNVLNVGLGRTDPERISSHVSDFCRYLRDTGKLPFEIPTRFVGHAYRLYAHHVPKLIDDGVMLIGDAAGLAFAKSGEGIRPAIESALLAVDTIVKGQSNYSRTSLASYEQQVVARLGNPQGRRLADFLPASWLAALAAKLVVNHWFAKNVIMDQWFLHSKQAAL
jgi:flavin-dependent dehydrogenase